MLYELFLTEKARRQLRALDKPNRRIIGQRLEALRFDLSGDVKKLVDRGNRYRLRVGDHRVLFTLESGSITVYALKNRKDVYE